VRLPKRSTFCAPVASSTATRAQGSWHFSLQLCGRGRQKSVQFLGHFFTQVMLQLSSIHGAIDDSECPCDQACDTRE
jgi:hypothetical protein